MAITHSIGEWVFTPDSNELRRGDEVVQLEHRAGRALELLCARRGETVSQAEIAAHLWGTRQVSGNSVAVVIRDLRKALGDDARDPVYLATVAKGGYRLIAANGGAKTRAVRPAVAAGVAGVLLLCGVGAFALNRAERPAPARLMILDELHNETGVASYDGLAKASGEYLLTSLSRQPGLRLVRASEAKDAADDAAIHMHAKLVLWSGQPDVVMTAEDARSANVLWSGYAFGAENTIPRKIDAAIGEMSKTLAAKK